MSETAAQGDELLADIEEAMRDVVPELGINVVDLGLVYGLNVEKGETGPVALIDMTLTSAACPLTDVIEDQSRTALPPAGRTAMNVAFNAVIRPQNAATHTTIALWSPFRRSSGEVVSLVAH